MKKTYQITREALRKKDFKAGSTRLTSASKSTDKIDLVAAVLKELIANK